MLLAAIEPPLSIIVSGLALEATTDDPAPHAFDKVVGTTSSPEGTVSVKTTPVSAVAVFGFETVKVIGVVLPVITLVEPKDLAITGGATTASEAVP